MITNDFIMTAALVMSTVFLIVLGQQWEILDLLWHDSTYSCDIHNNNIFLDSKIKAKHILRWLIEPVLLVNEWSQYYLIKKIYK
jgi:hypothetical protein